jgi:AbrB family looped-hinge helix DNA binding protein
LSEIELVYLKVTDRGRIVIPQDVRERLKIDDGDWVSITIQKLEPKVKQD